MKNTRPKQEALLVAWHSTQVGLGVMHNALRLLKEKQVRIHSVLYLVQERGHLPAKTDPLGEDIRFEGMELALSDPTAHSAIYAQMRDQVLPRIHQHTGEVHINITPGTKSMHAVWLLLYAGGAFPDGTRLWSTQEVKQAQTTRIDAVDFYLPTYLAEIRKQAERQPRRAHFNAEPRSKARREAQVRLQRLARIPRMPFMILGERGTGKTRLVEDQLGPLKDKKKVHTVACGTLHTGDPTMALSTLFGHARGAFSGATSDRPGIVEKAQGSILFLDEVQDLPPSAQRQLVRLLGDPRRPYRRVGEDSERHAPDLEIVCASHLGLAELRGKLDLDLFDRLSLLFLEWPPLRECREDLETDFQQVWRELNRRQELMPEAPTDRRILDALRAHPLPGNLRDLQRMALLLMAHHSTGRAWIETAVAEWEELQGRMAAVERAAEDGATGALPPGKTWQELKERALANIAQRAIDQYGSVTEAAKALKADVKTLREARKR